MDGFRERLSGRFERSSERGGLDRSGADRYERSQRSTAAGNFDGSGIKVVTEVIDKSNTKQLEIISDFFDEAKDERAAIGKELLQALDENTEILDKSAEMIRHHTELLNDIRVDLSEQARTPAQTPAPVHVPSVDSTAKEEIMQAVLGNTTLLNMVRQEIAASRKVLAEPSAEEASLNMEEIDVYFKNMEDHVHKENVKCYRNVQAVVTEQGAQTVEQTKKSLGTLKVFTIISIVLSIVNIGLLAAYIFGVI
ncbi:MAG: hypothetical protein QM697_11875 [Lachnospiraceae bacterium]